MSVVNMPLLTRFVRFLVAVAAAAGTLAASAQQMPQARLPTVTLNAGMHQIIAEVAGTATQREIGMMMRTQMAAHEGMLFVFEQPSQQCFWMRNTLLPLSIAFLADDGTIVNVLEMKPQTLDSHCSAQPVRLVLEMNTGWFAKRGLKAGDRLRGAPFKN